MRKTALIISFIFALTSIKAQNSFSAKFLEANTLIEESQYNIALPLWLTLLNEKPENSNLNYKIGLCYLKSANEKNKALDYLLKASENISKNYDPFSSLEKKSPVETYFYLAKAYHLNSKIDAAITNYSAFKKKVSKKHYLFKEIDHHLEQCEYAKKAIADPVNIIVSNLGESINSPFADYSPVISVDESTIYFTSRRLRPDSSNYYIKDASDGQHFEDIYVSHNYDDSWSTPEIVNINSEEHDAVINISTDGQTLFVYKDDKGDGNIYISNRENEGWSTLEKLGSNVNEKSRETHAHISPNNNFLYFVSDREGGLGGQDIYVCKRLPNGEWALAQNMGSTINTPYDEEGVFIHPDGKTMYFSSKGHTSIGGYDFFSTTIDEQGIWSTPINLGYPINSTDNDVFFVTSADGKRGYYSSFQQSGYGEKDIYKISLEDASSQPVTLLTGYLKVAGTTETPENSEVVVTNNETGEFIGVYRPRKKDGKFSIILTSNIDYHITYSAEKYQQEEDIYIPAISSYQEINRGIILDEVVFGIEAEKMIKSGRARLDQLKAVGKGLDLLTLDDLNEEQKTELAKLKAEHSILDQLKENEWNDVHENELANTQINFEKLKASLDSLEKIKSEDVIESLMANDPQSKGTDLNIETVKMMNSKKIRFEKLKAVSHGIELLELNDLNENQRLELAKLKAELNSLDQLKENEWNDVLENELVNTQINFEKLKASVDSLEKIKSEDGIEMLSSDSDHEKINSSYQLFFDYNNKDINTSNPEYIHLIEVAVQQFKATGKVKISIESSASSVPTKKYVTNNQLANRRATLAKEVVLKSLNQKGIEKKNITILKVTAKVNGPKYNGDFKNKAIYKKHQFVKIQIH
jgi:hypothetical protein